MHRINLHLSVLVVALFGLAIYGCTPSQPTTIPAVPADADADMDHGGHDHAGNENEGDEAESDMDKMKAELAKLPAEDRLAAEKQHLCPVSGEMLGVMGAPLKVAVKGQHVWLCCEGCKDQLLANPDEFLAKLPK